MPVTNYCRYETYLIPGETLIPGGGGKGEGGKGEAFHPGIGYASYPHYWVVILAMWKAK